MYCIKFGWPSTFPFFTSCDCFSFGGPAVTVQVHCSSTPRLACAPRSKIRTREEGVTETARRFTPVDIVLHPRQVSILNDDEPLVCLCGPPGTGKSLVLFVRALDWLTRCEKPVHVVSTSDTSVGVSYLLKKQLELEVGPEAAQRLHMHILNLRDNFEAALESLISAAQEQDGQLELFVITDEVRDVKQ